MGDALAKTCQKYWVGKPKYWGAEGGKSYKCTGVSQLLGARVRAAPKVCAYVCNENSTADRKYTNSTYSTPFKARRVSFGCDPTRHSYAITPTLHKSTL